MKPKRRKIPFLLAFLLFLGMACAVPALPFLGGDEAAAPLSEVDEASLATMVADAAAQKVKQTLEAMPPTLTPTKTPTETPIPSPTATEIPPTGTPTEVDYPATGSDLEEKDDGTTRYRDYAGGYEIHIPVVWLALRPGEEEYTQAWSLPEASDPAVQNSLREMQSLDPGVYRLFALDIREGHYSNGFVTNLNFVLGTESEASLEETFAESVLTLPDAVPGTVVIDSSLTETEAGIPYGNIESERELQGTAENPLTLYQKQAIFMVKKRPLVITFTSTTDFKDQVIGEFDAMLNTFSLLE